MFPLRLLPWILLWHRQTRKKGEDEKDKRKKENRHIPGVSPIPSFFTKSEKEVERRAEEGDAHTEIATWSVIRSRWGCFRSGCCFGYPCGIYKTG
jgi:hypothetical protein